MEFKRSKNVRQFIYSELVWKAYMYNVASSNGPGDNAGMSFVSRV